MTVGFESFSIFDVEKNFRNRTSAGKQLFSPFIEILGFEWCVSIQNNNKENESFGIYLYRKVKEKLDKFWF